MCRIAVAAAALLAALFLAVPVRAQTGVNLLRLPDDSRCTSDVQAATTIPGWTVLDGSPSLLCPGTVAGWTGASPPDLIGSGPWGASALERRVSVEAAAGIDDGKAALAVSGWLGAAGSVPALLRATFLDAAGRAVGRAVELTGPEASRNDRRPVFRRQSAAEQVPPGTRSVLLTLRLDGAAYVGDLALTLAPPLAAAPLTPPPSAVPRFDHVFLIMMENTDFGQVIGDTQNAPYINGLAEHGVLLARFNAVYHPSDQNYLAIAGGDTFVRGESYFPKIRLAAPHIGDKIEAAGKSWKAYEQGTGTPCNITTRYDKYFEPDDAPFVNFANVIGDPARCPSHLVDTDALAGDLAKAASTPNFAWIAADDYFDGEDSGNGSPASLRVQDGWLKRTLEPLFAAPAWTDDRSLLILTWDESNATLNNHIATILLGSQGLVRTGWISPVAYDHYSIARTIEEALGLASLTTNDGYARPINDAFAGGGK